MSRQILFDATHTSHTRAQTGIQRVVRSLFAALQGRAPVHGVCHDPHLDAWRLLDKNELIVLGDLSAGDAKSRGSHWSLVQKISGHARRLTDSRPPLPAASGFICPEIFSARTGRNLPALLGRIAGPRVAIFYDAIPLKYPELTPAATVARFPAYLRELLVFDGVAAISEDSAAALRDFWKWLGVADVPPVQAIPLAVDRPHTHANQDTAPAPAGVRPRIFSIGTIEGRKNHLALLQAAQALWDEGVDFELELIGMARPDTAAAALAAIDTLRRAGRPLTYHGSVNEASLHRAYARSSFTVYPSLMEGFGLPVLESLQHGKPCVCSAHGALGETAAGGGVLALESVDAPALTRALRHLLSHPAELAVLAAAARNRKFRSWQDYAADFTTWMTTLPQR